MYWISDLVTKIGNVYILKDLTIFLLLGLFLLYVFISDRYRYSLILKVSISLSESVVSYRAEGDMTKISYRDT